MNKHNLIKLGALAQKTFKMKDDFKIMELPSDSPPRVRIAIPSAVDVVPFFDLVEVVAMPLTDEIDLQKFGSKDNYEYILCGCSARANVLVIREPNNGPCR